MSPLEALADAIMQYEGWFKDSHSWRNRNPGNLRPFIKGQLEDANGYRVFDSLTEGFAALSADLQSKLNGSHGLTPSATILDLISVYAPSNDYNDPIKYARFVCDWTSHALARNITLTTTLEEYTRGA